MDGFHYCVLYSDAGAKSVGGSVSFLDAHPQRVPIGVSGIDASEGCAQRTLHSEQAAKAAGRLKRLLIAP